MFRWIISMFSFTRLWPFGGWALPNQKTKPACVPCWLQAWALASGQCLVQESTLPCPEHTWARTGGPQVSPQSLIAGFAFLSVPSLSGSWRLSYLSLHSEGNKSSQQAAEDHHTESLSTFTLPGPLSCSLRSSLICLLLSLSLATFLSVRGDKLH